MEVNYHPPTTSHKLDHPGPIEILYHVGILLWHFLMTGALLRLWATCPLILHIRTHYIHGHSCHSLGILQTHTAASSLLLLPLPPWDFYQLGWGFPTTFSSREWQPCTCVGHWVPLLDDFVKCLLQHARAHEGKDCTSWIYWSKLYKHCVSLSIVTY